MARLFLVGKARPVLKAGKLERAGNPSSWDNTDILLRLYLLKSTGSLKNSPLAWQMTFSNPANTVMGAIIDLHHDIMFFMVIIFIFVCYMMGVTLVSFQSSLIESGLKRRLPSTQTHNTLIEVIWTVIPGVLLFLIGLPSISLLYTSGYSVSADPRITIKVLGSQWY